MFNIQDFCWVSLIERGCPDMKKLFQGEGGLGFRLKSDEGLQIGGMGSQAKSDEK